MHTGISLLRYCEWRVEGFLQSREKIGPRFSYSRKVLYFYSLLDKKAMREILDMLFFCWRIKYILQIIFRIRTRTLAVISLTHTIRARARANSTVCTFDLFEIVRVTKYRFFFSNCLPAARARSSPFAQLPSFSFDRWYVPAATQIDTSPGFSWNDSLARDVLVMTVRRVTSGRPLFHRNSVSRRRAAPHRAGKRWKMWKTKSPFTWCRVTFV